MDLVKNLRKIIHYLITIFILFGWAHDNKKLLLIHMIFICGVLIHWITNNNRCFLSEYDYGDDPNAYTKNLLNKVGIKLNNKIIQFIPYLSLFIPFIISVIKINNFFI